MSFSNIIKTLDSASAFELYRFAWDGEFPFIHGAKFQSLQDASMKFQRIESLNLRDAQYSLAYA